MLRHTAGWMLQAFLMTVSVGAEASSTTTPPLQPESPITEATSWQNTDPDSGGWIDHFDHFSAAHWCVSKDSYVPFWARDGMSGSWEPAAVSVENGHLVLRTVVQDRKVAAAEIYTCQKFGFGTYEALVMAPSLGGTVSSMMSYVDGSRTEIDFEFEGRAPDMLHMVTWTSLDAKEHNLYNHGSAFPGTWTRLKYEWRPTGVEFFVDDVPVAHHRQVVPFAPAHVMFNTWPTDNPEWGGSSANGTAVMLVDWIRFTPADVPAQSFGGADR